ncbi:biotin transporter BioY [Amphibacillus indicireducens]|uniref:Biotin transporter n=1 Tax=Amphibacillus indicireducens TaxID=1076330 RepID=A0ABP7VIK2_9BACI
MKMTTLELCYSAIFICLMAIGANLTSWLPFLAIPIAGVSVPLSLQTFFSILAGLLLGKRIGTLSMIGYLLLGVIGIPVFAQMQGGLFVLINYTGGFLLSFVFVAYVSGFLTERKAITTQKSTIYVCLIGVGVNYIIGISYMYLAMNTWLGLELRYLSAWLSMLPFLIKDFGLALVAAFVFQRYQRRFPIISSRLKAKI